MNRQEYTDWVKYHAGLFPGFEKWYAGIAQDAVEVWREGMASVDFEHAKAASKQMAIGELEAPRGYTKHLPAIRRRARDLGFQTRPERPTVVDGQRAYRCPVCLDEGLVSIYQPAFIARLMEGDITDEAAEKKVRSCNTRCSCDASRRWGKLTEFAENQMIRWKIGGKVVESPMIRCSFPAGDDKMLEEAHAGLEAFQNRNRVAAFDAFNDGGAA